MPRWTEQSRERHRQLIYEIRPWNHTKGAKKTPWGAECSRWNCYRNMKQRTLNLNEQQQIAVAAASGLLEALRLTIQQSPNIVSKQHLQDFYLAIRILFKYTNASRDISNYGEIYKALVECNVPESTPPEGQNSEISDLEIASRALRAIARKYSDTKKLLLASESDQIQQIKECLALLD